MWVGVLRCGFDWGICVFVLGVYFVIGGVFKVWI